MRKFLAICAVALGLGTLNDAKAACISSTLIAAPDPSAGSVCSLRAGATSVNVVFAFANAADTNALYFGTDPTPLFTNKDPVGTAVTLSSLIVGQVLNFTWVNENTGDSFQAGISASDGDEHIAIQSSYTDFETDPPRVFLTSSDLGAAYTDMTKIAPIADWTFVGMEDLLADQGSDFDYNDFVFGVLSDGALPVREPSSLYLLLAALLGVIVLTLPRFRQHQRSRYGRLIRL